MSLLKGRVLYYREDNGKGYGFIVPIGLDGKKDRDRNVYFSPKELQGASVEKGDRVGYELDPTPREGKYRQYEGPRAKIVRVLDDRDDIVTLHGADEYR
jgi:cold shock CspA family protein